MAVSWLSKKKAPKSVLRKRPLLSNDVQDTVLDSDAGANWAADVFVVIVIVVVVGNVVCDVDDCTKVEVVSSLANASMHVLILDCKYARRIC